MRFLIALCVLLLPVALPAATPVDRPALWKVSDADTTIWLFGTIHVLPPGHKWLKGKIEQALDGSDELVLETDLSDPARAQAVILRHAIDPSGKPLASRIPQPLYTKLAESLAAAGIPPVSVERFEPWYAAMMVELLGYRALGLVAEEGVEARLLDRAHKRETKLVPLESLDEQVSYLDTLPLALQVELLSSTLDSSNDAPRVAAAMVDTWSKGDIKALARLINADMEGLPALRNILLDKRNVRWARWVQARLDRPGTAFVAVGAGHLGGSGNLRALLEAQGLRVKRAQ